MLPASNLKTFKGQSNLFDLIPPQLHVRAKRGFDGGAHAMEGAQVLAFSLATVEQPPDGIGQRGGAAQVERALPAAIAVAEREVGSQPPLADRAPSCDDRTLAREHGRLVGQELLDAGELLVNAIHFFQVGADALAWPRD
jgi:hypothetical protein